MCTDPGIIRWRCGPSSRFHGSRTFPHPGACHVPTTPGWAVEAKDRTRTQQAQRRSKCKAYLDPGEQTMSSLGLGGNDQLVRLPCFRTDLNFTSQPVFIRCSYHHEPQSNGGLRLGGGCCRRSAANMTSRLILESQQFATKVSTVPHLGYHGEFVEIPGLLLKRIIHIFVLVMRLRAPSLIVGK